MKQLEYAMELFDISVRRLSNGNKLRLTFESSEDLELEKALIEFRGENVRATFTQEFEPEQKEDKAFIEDLFEIFDIKVRRLRNGDKLRVVMEKLYEKNNELLFVKMRYDNVKIFMEKVDMELPGLKEKKMELLDVNDPEVENGE